MVAYGSGGDAVAAMPTDQIIAAGDVLDDDTDPDNGAVLTVTNINSTAGGDVVPDGDGETIQGDFGVLTIDDVGNYTYDIDETIPAAIDSQDGFNGGD